MSLPDSLSSTPGLSPVSAPEPPPPSPKELQQSIASLRALLQITLMAVVLALAALNYYVFHQTRALRNQGLDLQRAAREMHLAVGDYETNSVPLMERFVGDMKRFAERDAGFAPILAKYPLGPGAAKTNAPPVPPPSAAPPKPAVGGKK